MSPVRSTALLLCSLALLAVAGPAGATPIQCFCGGSGGGGGGGGGGGTPPNQAPVASFTVSPNPAIVSLRPMLPTNPPRPAPVDLGQDVTFDATASSDDRAIATYEWDLDGSGNFGTPSATDKVQTRSFYTTGTFTVRLRVTDASGLSSIATRTVTIRHAPHAAIAANVAAPLVGQPVTYSAAGSTGDPGIATYDWDLDGNGTFETSTGATPTVTTRYPSPGTRTVAVRVTDTIGTAVTASLTERVNPAPIAAPVATPSPAPTATNPATDTTAPRVTIGRAVTLSKSGTIAIAVTCPKSERSCTGRVSLRSLHLAGAFRITGGRTTLVRLHLTRAGQRRVRRVHTLRTRASATVTDAAGNTATTTATLSINS